MSIQIFILGKLMEKNSYPYLLKKQLSEPIPFDKMSGLTESKLYYNFEALSKKGLVEIVETIKEENRPDKQVFQITEKGKQTLPKLIYKLFENTKEISEMYVGVAYLKFVDNQKVINILESKIQDNKQMLIEAQEIKHKIQVTPENEGLLNFMSDHFTTKTNNTIQFLEKLITLIENENV
ncbi:PadR family transcriptional regulator [Staphylococcus cohnii]|uniref:PadR family transcriptional regulator n=1 Tax=Staphylococcus cohnii TaxID=29382 RepID=UPI001867336C|nr:PadR family transcriptional regulator [Staphylococcus cohnii]